MRWRTRRAGCSARGSSRRLLRSRPAATSAALVHAVEVGEDRAADLLVVDPQVVLEVALGGVAHVLREQARRGGDVKQGVERVDVRAHGEERVVRRPPQPAHRLVLDLEPHRTPDANLANARHHPLAWRVECGLGRVARAVRVAVGRRHEGRRPGEAKVGPPGRRRRAQLVEEAADGLLQIGRKAVHVSVHLLQVHPHPLEHAAK
mmetsp:Transcript_35177/g.113093  ORF Transcript_35177/g.113093 Transcript_35177/m.113093 type:complete len:205 (-) Transcript_35177:601-1215(-)